MTLRLQFRRRKVLIIVPTLLAMLTLLPGCAPHIGEGTVRTARFDYNEAMIRSWNEQLLLNLVRLRYRDNPLFLDMGTVVTHYEVSGALGTSESVSIPPKTGATYGVGLTAAVGYSESPTISYLPLQGEDYANRLLSPLTPSTLLLLSRSGWSLERLFLCGVQRMNGLGNAISATGPTPDTPPLYEGFNQAAELLRRLQVDGAIEADLDQDGETVLLYLQRGVTSRSDSAITTLQGLLRLDSTTTTYRVTAATRHTRNDEIAITGRSLMATLFFLSQSVEPPAQHESEGLVTITHRPDGARFDWSTITGRLLRVHCSSAPPERAAVSIRYREYWFYISDSDLNSKTTFNLLTYLFNLKAGSKSGHEPLLTYPVK
jgi:hypothetical protein